MTSPAPRYTYTPISKPGQIRLLSIEPGLETDLIRCSLAPAQLDEHPEYEALSYCWGDPSITHVISCNGKELGIPKNLYGALRSLRKRDSARTLWIDAVCINQADIHEKSRQIQIMTGIYTQATQVVVYLGDDSSDLKGLETFMSKAVQLLPAETYDNSMLSVTTTTMIEEAQRLEAEGKETWRTLNWDPYLNLLRRPWFYRKWIIQEVAFAKRAVTICGRDLSVPWAELATIAYRVSQYEIFSEVLPGRDIVDKTCRYANHNANMLLLIGLYRGQGGMLDLVLASQFFKCSVPQDYIFSLLSMAKDPHKSALVPDYTLSVGEVFRRFAVAAILEGGSLNIFSIAPGEPWLDEGETVPSWVPDLTGQNSEPLTSYSVRPRQFFSGGTGAPVVEVLEGGTALRCRGIIVDTIKTMADQTLLDSEMEIPVSREGRSDIVNWANGAVASWVLRSQSLAGIDLRDEDTPPERRRVFCRALMCDQTGMRDRLTDDVVDGLLTLLRQFIDLAAAKDAARTPVSQFSRKYLGQFRQSTSMAGQKRFCVTEAGRFGQVARMSREGDSIAVFLGAEVPTVVRPTDEGTYTVVGECYISGVMDGEVLLGKDGEEEDIILE
ncbi:uncharacterized protein DNG_09964 [Cephalotrichum gorgonifer]|uniref:Heterokaryon incompatibility domain-containing protein n=1 Tax=Cephalotrichum gorgonifer TaxID=2041049 RepID=A0AAE8N942_9PEZI|nr:uncharacterized protein DNG_09964 [Cephalotrichum gorgonifer]